MARKPKYPNIKSLKAAFERGDLSEYKVVVDNDDARLHFIGKVPHGVDPDIYTDRMNDKCANWYRGDGYQDIVKAYNAAGIPAEWV